MPNIRHYNYYRYFCYSHCCQCMFPVSESSSIVQSWGLFLKRLPISVLWLYPPSQTSSLLNLASRGAMFLSLFRCNCFAVEHEWNYKIIKGAFSQWFICSLETIIPFSTCHAFKTAHIYMTLIATRPHVVKSDEQKNVSCYSDVSYAVRLMSCKRKDEIRHCEPSKNNSSPKIQIFVGVPLFSLIFLKDTN